MPYKDLKKRRECARLSAQKSRKINPLKHKMLREKSRLKNYDKFLAQKRRHYYKYQTEILADRKKKNQNVRFQVIQHYTKGKFACSCCGENNYEFLTLEHINGGGGEERRRLGASNINRYLIKNNFPKGYDILCYNCNCAKAFVGICPHKTKGIISNFGKVELADKLRK